MVNINILQSSISYTEKNVWRKKVAMKIVDEDEEMDMDVVKDVMVSVLSYIMNFSVLITMILFFIINIVL